MSLLGVGVGWIDSEGWAVCEMENCGSCEDVVLVVATPVLWTDSNAVCVRGGEMEGVRLVGGVDEESAVTVQEAYLCEMSNVVHRNIAG